MVVRMDQRAQIQMERGYFRRMDGWMDGQTENITSLAPKGGGIITDLPKNLR